MQVLSPRAVDQRKAVGKPVLAVDRRLRVFQVVVPRAFRTKESLTIPIIAQESLELVSLNMENLRSSSSRSQMSSMSDNTVNKEEVSLVNVSPEKNWQD